MKTYRHTCPECGKKFENSMPATKYCCITCRCASVSRKEMQRYREKYHPVENLIYTCVACGRRILVHGRSANRKYCDDCLADMGTFGTKLLMSRKDLREEAIG